MKLETVSERSKNRALEVALLIEDQKVVKSISKMFESLDILPYFYESLESLWPSLTERTPTLLIVDVYKMSDSKNFIGNHPEILANNVQLAFLYNNRTRPLLASTEHLLHQGLICGDQALGPQIKEVLNRLNFLLSFSNQNNELALKNKNLGLKNERLRQSKDRIEETLYFQRLAGNWHQKVANEQFLEQSFDEIAYEFANHFEDIEHYCVMELNKANLKIIPRPFNGKKYLEIPSIWRGKETGDCIGKEGLALVNQVVAQVYGPNYRVLKIGENQNRIQKLITIKLRSSEFEQRICFDSLENSLSYLMQVCDFRPRTREKNLFKTAGELFDLLEKYQMDDLRMDRRGVQESEEKLIMAIDLRKFVKFNMTKNLQLFYWADFLNDFKHSLGKNLNGPFDIYDLSFELLIIETKRKFSEDIFHSLKEYVGQFSYWRYFEDAEFVDYNEKAPIEVKFIPYSSLSLYQFYQTGEYQLVQGVFHKAEEKNDGPMIQQSKTIQARSNQGFLEK